VSAETENAALPALEVRELRPGTTVVVGAAQGIGAVVAQRLAGEAWTERVVLADIDGDGVDRVAAGLRDAGHDVAALRVDVTDAAEVDALLEASRGALRVAIVAGTFFPTPSLEVTREQFRQIVDVNLHGAYFVAQAYAQAMAANGGGAIACVSSIAGRMPRMRQVAYCASKAGISHALRVLGMEVAHDGVRVNTVSPGLTDTPMMRRVAGDHAAVQQMADGTLEGFRPRIPDRRVATPTDVADALAFLLSPESDHITLQDLVVDGGELLGR
jgi:2,3-dihydro-2,3-dihydroxybenzoate dehydrogenase